MSEPLHMETRRGMREDEARRERGLPQWRVALPIVATYLDVESLAAASWSTAFGADDLWARSSAAPTSRPRSGSFTCSTTTAAPTARGPQSSSHRRLFGLFHSATSHGHRPLHPPRLALDDVSFAIDIEAGGNNVLSFAVDAGPRDSVFQFGVDTSERNAAVGRARWSVRLTAVRAEPGFAPGAFVMVDLVPEEMEMPKAPEIGMGVCAELPAPGGCRDWGHATPEARVEIKVTGEKRFVQEVNFGVTLLTSDSDSDGRYVSVDDGLRYLQNFLM